MVCRYTSTLTTVKFIVHPVSSLRDVAFSLTVILVRLYTRLEHRLKSFCCSSSATPSSSLCHRLLFPSISGVVYPLATRLRKLHYWLRYQPIFSDDYSLCSTLQLVWCSSFDATTTSLTPLQSPTGCVNHNGSTTKLLSWHFEHKTPPYLNPAVSFADLPGRHRLRPSSSHWLRVPGYRIATVGRRSFPVAAFIFLNSLPPDIQSSPSPTDFCHRLKIYLFHQSFPDILR